MRGNPIPPMTLINGLYCIVYFAIILNTLLLSITEEVRNCTDQRTISACVMYYSKKVHAFIRAATIHQCIGEPQYFSNDINIDI